MYKQYFILCFTAFFPLKVLSDCGSSDDVRALDHKYEHALQIGDVDYLEQLLAPEYVWVHNHASEKETKADLMVRLVASGSMSYRSRESRDIQVVREGNTFVAIGRSIVSRYSAVWGDENNLSVSEYQFQRVYVNAADSCRLLAVQTMKLMSDE